MIQSFGTVNYAKNPHGADAWVIRCEPHVRSRIKRVFPRAPQHASDTITISSNPENCRDLLWFLDRYPMAVDRKDLLEQLSQEHIATEEAIAAVLAGHKPPAEINLAKPPREYQTVAAQLLEVKRGLLLADDVGLGKTVTAICSMTNPANLPALVVCPTHLPNQWASMIHEFAPDLSVHIVKKGTPYALRKALKNGQLELIGDRLPDVLIINYHKLRGWAEKLAGAMRYVVFDECQQLRTAGGLIHQAAKHVADKAHRRLGLSATPIYNYGAEFFNVVDAIEPGALGERHEFIREWCSGDWNQKSRIKDTKEFGAYLRREGIMLRRTRAEVGRELPDVTKVIHTVEADQAALNDLKGNAITLAKIVLGHNEKYRGEKMQAAAEFDTAMRQATGIAKAPYVAEFIRLLMDSEERIVLFGWHREVYSIWLEALKEFNPVLYTGTESEPQKAASKNAFMEGRSRILVMSLRSGAGVDGLQGVCRTAVFGELDWSPGVHEQCVGRIHRDGQDEPCVAFFLVADDGADPIMVDVLGIKREQIEGVRNPDRALIERIETGENSIRRMAREFLERRGVDVTPDRKALEFPEPAGVA